ncbi:hypothetical protein LP085_08090 [Achromobacter sp. MY14]|uniref:hypothetical protein n=1 Tax=unclassified Achromobacter TaxID=2626865 RepID=UPI001E483C8C|nr:hypothetical protein [Achromobacter sp. MY14]MCD0496806.1 hypothetical protein [Achromobacter sp. MY14]
MKSVLATLFTAIAFTSTAYAATSTVIEKTLVSAQVIDGQTKIFFNDKNNLSDSDLKRVRKYVDEFKRENTNYRICVLELNYQKTDLDEITIENKAKCKR